MSPIITLTTDFGTQDGFTAQMKGVILQINPTVQLVDATHDISAFSVMEGALVLKGLSEFFPPETIHIGVVDPGVGSDRRGIAVLARSQVFVGPDNGLFTWLLGSGSSWEARQIQNPEFFFPDPQPTFHGRDIFAPAAAFLSIGKDFARIGQRVEDPVILSSAQPCITSAGIEGQVLHIDRFGNLSTNVDRQMLTRSVSAVEVGNVVIQGMSRFFGQATPGQPLALINSFGLLEIAINCGDAAEILGVKVTDHVFVRWG